MTDPLLTGSTNIKGQRLLPTQKEAGTAGEPPRRWMNDGTDANVVLIPNLVPDRAGREYHATLDALIAKRRQYGLEQESDERDGVAGAARADLGDFCSTIAQQWPDAVTVDFTPDEDGDDDMIWVGLTDKDGADIDCSALDGSWDSPTEVLGGYDTELFREFFETTINVSELANEYNTAQAAAMARAQSANADSARANMARSDIADFSVDIVKLWPDAVTAKFEADGDGDEFLWVKLYDAKGDVFKAYSDDESDSDGLDADRLLHAYAYESTSLFEGVTVNLRELAEWDPYAPAATDWAAQDWDFNYVHEDGPLSPIVAVYIYDGPHAGKTVKLDEPIDA